MRYFSTRLFNGFRSAFTLAWVIAILTPFPRDCPAQSALGETVYSDAFPPAMKYWREQREQLQEGVVQADALRAKLLTASPQGDTYLGRIVNAVTLYQKDAASSANDLVSTRSFTITEEKLRNQLMGRTTLAPEQAFRGFEGKWYGLWDRWPMNHDWSATEIFSPPKTVAEAAPKVAALQYVWIGSGFGWNYMVQPKGETGFVALGQVYYGEEPDYMKMGGAKPHVGYVDVSAPDKPATRLVWITEYEIFLEEVFPDEKGQLNRYAITGVYHSLLNEPPTLSPNAVQAVYTRDSVHRPKFRHIEWNPEQ